jgi:DNA-directed RNA polymerase subunit RPC12/RpoP
MNQNDNYFDNLWKQQEQHHDPRSDWEKQYHHFGYDPGVNPQQNNKSTTQGESFTGKCRDCGKEVEKPYIMCEDCHHNYLVKISKNK